MMKEFEMIDIGLMRYFFFAVEVIQFVAKNFMYQKKYVQELLERFKMDEAHIWNSMRIEFEVAQGY